MALAHVRPAVASEALRDLDLAHRRDGAVVRNGAAVHCTGGEGVRVGSRRIIQKSFMSVTDVLRRPRLELEFGGAAAPLLPQAVPSSPSTTICVAPISSLSFPNSYKRVFHALIDPQHTDASTCACSIPARFRLDF